MHWCHFSFFPTVSTMTTVHDGRGSMHVWQPWFAKHSSFKFKICLEDVLNADRWRSGSLFCRDVLHHVHHVIYFARTSCEINLHDLSRLRISDGESLDSARWANFRILISKMSTKHPIPEPFKWDNSFEVFVSIEFFNQNKMIN